MTDKIILTGIEIFGHHGCSVEEQNRGQIFKVDLELNLDLSKSCASDELTDTVDYATILFEVEKIVAGKPRKLIETVAAEIAEKILRDFNLIESLTVTLHKPDAPLPIKYFDAAIKIFRTKN